MKESFVVSLAAAAAAALVPPQQLQQQNSGDSGFLTGKFLWNHDHRETEVREAMSCHHLNSLVAGEGTDAYRAIHVNLVSAWTATALERKAGACCRYYIKCRV